MSTLINKLNKAVCASSADLPGNFLTRDTATRSRSNSRSSFMSNFSFTTKTSLHESSIETSTMTPKIEKSLSYNGCSIASSGMLRNFLPSFDLKPTTTFASSPSAAISCSSSNNSNNNNTMSNNINCSSNSNSISSNSNSNSSNSSSICQSSSFIEPMDLKNELETVILLDCRTYTDFNVKHIKDSVHLNCRDNIIRKRLQSRKLTVKDLINNEEIRNKLFSSTVASNASEQQADSLVPQVANKNETVDQVVAVRKESNESDSTAANRSITKAKAKSAENIIVLYDDTTSDLNDLQVASNPLKIVQENIKHCGYNKECKILKGGFKKFVEMWPNFCVFKEKCEKPVRSSAPPCEQISDLKQSDIENAVMNEILPHLYLGNEVDARNEKKLEQNNIFYILNITKNSPFHTNNSKFVHKRIAVDDCGRSNLKNHFDEAIEFIELAKQNGSKVLVHCQAGISRSPTVIIAYLIKKYDMTLDEAYSKVRELRPIVSPNIGFFGQLMDYESKLRAARPKPPLTSTSSSSSSSSASSTSKEDASAQSELDVLAKTQNVNTTSSTGNTLSSVQMSYEEARSDDEISLNDKQEDGEQRMDFMQSSSSQEDVNVDMDDYDHQLRSHCDDQKSLDRALVCH